MSCFPTCQVCQQQFSMNGPSPSLLPCLHSVCETCVTSAAGGVISCSTCQSDVNLTETGLQKDVIAEKEILHLTVKHHPELVLCTHEEDGNQAVCWCKECEDFLCENCQMIHDRFKVTRQHIVEDIADLQPGSFDVETYCTLHPKYLLDTWDEQCCIPICRICQDQEHAEHKSLVFDKAVEIARREINDFEKELQTSVTQQGTYLTTMDTDLKASDETCDNLTENISLTFNSLKTLIDQREKELQIELQQRQDKVRRELNKKKNTSEACQQKCHTTSDYINKTLQYSSRHDIMSLRHILQSKTGECILSAQAIVHESPPLPKFNTDGLEKIKNVMAGFGRLAWIDDTAEEKQTKECKTQTDDWVSTECEELKLVLLQLKTLHDKEIQSLRETLTKVKEEEKKGLYRLKTNVSDVAYMLNCARVEFSRTQYNAEYVHINTEGELINRAQTNLSHNDQRLKMYRGTSGTAPLSRCGSPQYWEVNTKISIERAIPNGRLFFEIGMRRQVDKDLSHWMGFGFKSYSLSLHHCATHSFICRTVVGPDGNRLCLPDTLKNTPGTSATRHVGVVYDSVRSRIAFLDVKKEKIMYKTNIVDSSVDLWPMFGVYNPEWATVSMSLIVGKDIDMTERKRELLLQSLS